MMRLTIALVLLLSCLTAAGQQVEDLGLTPEQMEDKLLVLVNQERSSRGLPVLGCSPLLRGMARDHSHKMIREGRLAHDFPGYEDLAERAARAGLNFSKIGENVARSETFVVRFFHEALLASPEHRANILDGEFTQLGIGIEKTGALSERGGTATYFVSQEFARLFDPVSPQDVERELSAKLAIRFGGNAELSSGTAEEVREFCRRLSSLFLQGRAPDKIPATQGTFSLLTLNFIELESGLVSILTQVQGMQPAYWSLGAAYGRTAQCPGGTYVLTLALFSDLQDTLDTASIMDTMEFKALDPAEASSPFPAPLPFSRR